MGVSLFATRFFLSRPWGLSRARFCLVTAILVTLFLVVRIEYRASFGLLDGRWFAYTGRLLLLSLHHLNPLIIALLAGIYFSWWGIRWGSSIIFFSNIYRSFLAGLIAMALIVIILTASSRTVDISIGTYVAGFFFFSLVALALGNREVILQRVLKGKGGSKSRFPTGRLYVLLGVIAGIVLLGIALAGILSAAGLQETLKNIMHTIGDWLYQIISYLLTAVGYLALGISYILKLLVNLVLAEEIMPSEPSGEPEPTPEPTPVTPLVFPPEVILAIKWGFIAILAAAVVFFLVKAITRHPSFRPSGDIEETRESLWSWGLFKADLRLFFMMFWQKFKRQKRPPVLHDTTPPWYNDEDIPYIFDIREIYRHLLWEAAAAGTTRHSYETAYEHAQRLMRLTPDSTQPLTEISQLYSEVRYGDRQPPGKQIERANRLWQALRSILRRQRKPD